MRTLTPSRLSPCALPCEAEYIVPGDVITLRTNDPRIVTLADRLWDRLPAGRQRRRGERTPIALSIEVSPTEGVASSPRSLTERWLLEADDAELSVGDDQAYARITSATSEVTGRVSSMLVDEEPSVVSRLVLETPVAALLARRGYCVLHAGAVVGRAGAVVIRGRGGAGKSTLVAAAHRAGLHVLGDESVLVARDDPDAILAGVRDVTLLEDGARLVGVDAEARAVEGASERKYRVDLFASSSAALRSARRVATVLLGPRDGGPARLESVSPAQFLEEFAAGGIPQEQRFGTPQYIAAHWARHGALRLSGAADLPGAVALLAGLVAHPVALRSA